MRHALRADRKVITLGESKDLFLGPRCDGTVELAGHSGSEVDFVLSFDELVEGK